jgi:hypothetical protein
MGCYIQTNKELTGNHVVMENLQTREEYKTTNSVKINN